MLHIITHYLCATSLLLVSARSASSHLALLVQHGQGRQVLAWVESGLGVVLLHAVHVVPGVHEVVTKTVVVEVLTLKYQSQSPAEGKTLATDQTDRIMKPGDQKHPTGVLTGA